MKKRLLTSFFLITLCIVRLPLHAAQAETGSISVSPGIIDSEVSAANSEQTISLSITNSYPAAIVLVPTLQLIDQDSGTLTPTGKPDTSLDKNITFAASDIVVLGNSSTSIPISFHDTADLSPGGHYTALVLTSKDTSSGSVNFQSAISIGVYFVKRGGERQSVQLTSVKESHFIFSLPKKINLVFKNDGNVHIVPRATVSITKKGQPDAFLQGVANENSRTILPGKSLSDAVTLRSLQQAWWPGSYTLHVQTRADGINGFEETSRSFYFVPPLFIALTMVILLLSLGIFILVRNLLIRRKSRIKSMLTSLQSTPGKIHVKVIRRVSVKSQDTSPSQVNVKKKSSKKRTL